MNPERLQFLKDLRGLKENTGFRKYMKSIEKAMEWEMTTLSTIDPTDLTEVARLQGSVGSKRSLIEEFNSCNELIKSLEQPVKKEDKQTVGRVALPKQ